MRPHRVRCLLGRHSSVECVTDMEIIGMAAPRGIGPHPERGEQRQPPMITARVLASHMACAFCGHQKKGNP